MKNIAPNIPEKYMEIWQAAIPYFAQARSGDMKHSCDIANEVYQQGSAKKLDLDVLIPAAIFHDIGHAAILPEHMWMVTGTKKLKGSKLVHMLTGAKIAKDALDKIGYDRELTAEIVRLISFHDSPDNELFDTPEAILLSDTDKLARFKPEGFAEVLEDFGISAEDALLLLKDEMIKKIIAPENKLKAEKLLLELAGKYKVKL